jgi:hypothetical protein
MKQCIKIKHNKNKKLARPTHVKKIKIKASTPHTRQKNKKEIKIKKCVPAYF